MKKFLSLALVVCMILTCSLTVCAHETIVSYEGDGTSEWTLEVPISMAPGETKNVTLDGSWDSRTTISVTTDNTVSLTNSLKSSDVKVLNVDFNGFNQVGNNMEEISLSEDITVDAMSSALFGTWRGIITYTLTVNTNTNVAEIEGVEYETLQEAIDAANNGDTVTLMACVEESVRVYEGQDIIIDLNGYNIVGEYLEGTDIAPASKIVDYSAITNEGTLTIKGNGIVDGRTDSCSALFNLGTATLLGGTYTRSIEDAKVAGTYRDYDVNTFYTITNVGTLTIDDNSVIVRSDSARSSTIANGWNTTPTNMSIQYYDIDGTLIVNAGKITGGRHAITNNFGNTTINGGTLSSKADGKDVIGHDNDKLTINGGEIISGTGVAITAEPNTEIEINGGTIVGSINADNTVVITDNR